jgi:hypothetical protein
MLEISYLIKLVRRTRNNLSENAGEILMNGIIYPYEATEVFPFNCRGDVAIHSGALSHHGSCEPDLFQSDRHIQRRSHRVGDIIGTE